MTLAMDSSVARGAASRVGAGWLRTMELKTVWLQKAVEDGRVWLVSVLGSRHVAANGADGRMMLAGMAGLVTQRG